MRVSGRTSLNSPLSQTKSWPTFGHHRSRGGWWAHSMAGRASCRRIMWRILRTNPHHRASCPSATQTSSRALPGGLYASGVVWDAWHSCTNKSHTMEAIWAYLFLLECGKCCLRGDAMIYVSLNSSQEECCHPVCYPWWDFKEASTPYQILRCIDIFSVVFMYRKRESINFLKKWALWGSGSALCESKWTSVCQMAARSLLWCARQQQCSVWVWLLQGEPAPTSLQVGWRCLCRTVKCSSSSSSSSPACSELRGSQDERSFL